MLDENLIYLCFDGVLLLGLLFGMPTFCRWVDTIVQSFYSSVEYKIEAVAPEAEARFLKANKTAVTPEKAAEIARTLGADEGDIEGMLGKAAALRISSPDKAVYIYEMDVD